MDKAYFLDMKKKVQEFQKKMEEEGKQFFSELAKDLFEQNPSLLKFGWVQYTPYFNDGDACYFSAQLSEPRILLDGQDEDSYDDYLYYREDDNGHEAKVWRNVVDFLEQFDHNDVESMFGDHCEVIVTRDGVEVEEYSHD